MSARRTSSAIVSETASPALAGVLAALAAGLALLHYSRLPLNHDCAWFLDATGRFLDGALLYRDILEINPPLAFYLTIPVVAAGRATGLSLAPVFLAYVSLLSGLSAVAVWSTLRRTALPASAVWAAFAGMLFACLVASNGTFGQREHFTLLSTLPYFALAVLRAEKGRCPTLLAVLVGVAAGLGFCLKPHFLLAPVGVEVWLAYRGNAARTLLRPELAALAMTGVLYGAAIPLFTPDYLGIVVPLGRAVYDAGYGATFLDLVLAAFPHALALAALVGTLAARQEEKARDLLAVLGIAGTGFLAAYFIQGKGYAYHRVPAFGLLVVLCFVSAAVLGRGCLKPAIGRWRRLVFGTIAIATPLLLVQPSYVNAFLAPGRAILARHPSGSVYVLSSRFPASYPLLTEAGMRSASRFPCLWPLPGLLQRLGSHPEPREVAQLAQIERLVTEFVVQDFDRHFPSLVLVDTGVLNPAGMPSGFDARALFRKDERFARSWARYAPDGRVGPYAIYRRAAPSPPASGPSG